MALDEQLVADYELKINQLEKSCATVKQTTAPNTIEELFCSRNPLNQISVRYCLYQNMQKPNNDISLKFEVPLYASDGKLAQYMTVSMPCNILGRASGL